jgi:asparagine synthase (glutamine-hydrolysing)
MNEIYVENNNLVTEHNWNEIINKIKTNFDDLETNKERAKRVLKDLIINSIKNRITNNSGILFSGGIDSTLISLVCKNLNYNFNCYTVGLENAQDIEFAKKIAREYHFNLRYRILTLEEFQIVIKKVTQILNQPDVMKVGVGSVLYASSLLAKKDNINVLFSGLGSEEIFAGYQRHKEISNNLEALHKECFNGLRGMWSRDLKRDFLIAKNLNINLKTPFLDLEVMRYAMKIHPMHKISDDENKIIIREIAEGLGLKKEFAWRKKKAAQYGSNFIKGIDKLAKKNGFGLKKDYLQSLI